MIIGGIKHYKMFRIAKQQSLMRLMKFLQSLKVFTMPLPIADTKENLMRSGK